MNAIKFLMISVLLVSIVSCEEFLEPEPTNARTKDQMLIPEYWEGILLNAYGAIPGGLNFEEDYLSDDAVFNKNDAGIVVAATGGASSTRNAASNWTWMYQRLHYANLFLENVETVEWSLQSELQNTLYIDKLKGEAYAIRAYIGFTLLKGFAGYSQTGGELLGYPLIESVLSPGGVWKIPRASFQDCMDAILTDCDEAIALLPYIYKDLEPGEGSSSDYEINFNKSNGARNTGRIDGRAMKAMRTRILLYAASPAFNPDSDISKWQAAADRSAEVMAENDGLSSLKEEGLTFYLIQNSDLKNGEINDEIMWKGNSFRGTSVEETHFPPSLKGSGQLNPTQNLVDAFPMANGYPISDAANSGYDPANPYQGRDPRLELYILYQGSDLKGNTINPLTDATDGLGKTNASRSGYYVKKFMNERAELDPNIGEISVDHFTIMARYTEILLNYAEAVNELSGPEGSIGGQPSVREVIAAIRNRAGLTQPDNYLASITSKDNFRELIKNERRLELCFEKHRYWDLRRWKELDNVNTTLFGASSTDGSEIKYFEIEKRSYLSIYGPLPYTEVTKYDELLQNANW